jgi:hypothetical protein
VKTEPPNKRMQLTKLRAAPERQDKVPPCAPAGETDGGTASQLIRGVRRTRCGNEEGGARVTVARRRALSSALILMRAGASRGERPWELGGIAALMR